MHLLAEAVGVAPDPSPPRVEAELAHERGERRAQFQPAAAGADGLGGHPEEQETGQRAVGIAADAVLLVIPSRPDGERQVTVAPLPDRDIARVGVRQGDLDDLASDERPVQVADLRIIENRFGRVEDAVLYASKTLPGDGARRVLLAGRLRAIPPRRCVILRHVRVLC